MQNIPVITWFILKGKAKCCGASISVEYPLTEAIGASLSWLLFQRFVPTIFDLDAAHLTAWALYYCFAMMLVIAAMVDLKYRIIPDEVTIYAVPVGLLGVILLNTLGYQGWLDISWQNAALGAAVTGGLMASLSLSFLYIFNRDGLGWGDVKLLTAIGAFIGLAPGAWFVLMFGSLLGSTVGLVHLLTTWKRAYLPFGPSLAIATIVYVLFGDWIVAILFPNLDAIL
jgi:leader peptidase (prepilin peptidase)/N-methyltransferase